MTDRDALALADYCFMEHLRHGNTVAACVEVAVKGYLYGIDHAQPWHSGSRVYPSPHQTYAEVTR